MSMHLVDLPSLFIRVPEAGHSSTAAEGIEDSGDNLGAFPEQQAAVASFLLTTLLSKQSCAVDDQPHNALLAFTSSVVSTLGAMYKSDGNIGSDFEEMLSR